MDYKLLNHVIQGERFFAFKVVDIHYGKRLFTFRNWSLPYRLTVHYCPSRTEADTTDNKIGNITKHTFWFATEKECFKHYDKIFTKKQQIRDILEKY